jgi:hypothetical protein
MLSGVVLALVFVAFMAAIWSVHQLNRYGRSRYGYEPFAPPNAALMCLPSFLLFSALAAAGGLPSAAELFGAAASAVAVKLWIWALFLVAMLGLLSWRTNVWIAVYAAPLLALAAPVILMTVLYERLSR